MMPSVTSEINLHSIMTAAAETMTEALNVNREDTIAIRCDEPNALGPYLKRAVEDRGAQAHILMVNATFWAQALKNPTDEILNAYRIHQEKLQALYAASSKRMVVEAQGAAEITAKLSDETKAFTKALHKENRKSWKGKPYILTLYPTEWEAQREGMSFDVYSKAVFSSWFAPWKKIEAVQQKLIALFNQAEKVEIAANLSDPDPSRHTRITMSIKNMTFANSTVFRNFPGSEIYSSPIKDSIEGQLFAPGVYMYEGHRMRDITLEFRKGKIVRAIAVEGEKELNAILDRDEGARYVGELGIGTNSLIRQLLINELLVEKMAGTIHLTPGNAYDYTEYNGQKVHVDNGNRSDIHWDIAISLKDGCIKLDDNIVQLNGRWIDPQFELLSAVY